MNSVLVIGGAGPLGMSTCKALANAGYVPVAYDQTRQGKEIREKWGPFIRGTLTEKERLSATINEYNPDAIILCPDHAEAENPVTDPVLAYRTALTGTLTLLELAVKHKIEHVIYVSNAAIYGDAGSLPVSENQPSAPIGIPGSSQMICERMIADFASAHAIRFAILRSFAIAGVDDDIADDVIQDRGFISNLMAVAIGLRPQVTIHGSNYTTRDGTIVRDYVHGADFAQALLRALRALETGSISRIYNIGAGIGTTALELAHLAERISGQRIPIVYGPKRDDEAPVLIADSSLARVMLGWTPKESAADLIIRTTWAQWYNRHIETSGNINSRAAG